jgi:hypothetical protein
MCASLLLSYTSSPLAPDLYIIKNKMSRNKEPMKAGSFISGGSRESPLLDTCSFCLHINDNISSATSLNSPYQNHGKILSFTPKKRGPEHISNEHMHKSPTPRK